MNRRLFAFTGASGVGKTTLLNEIAKWSNFKIVELSGRPYLPTNGDYVTNKSDSINRRIAYGSLVTMTEAILKYPNEHLFFSRCAIDRLAYGRALDVGVDLHWVIEKEIIDVLIPFITIFYLPIEFPLLNQDDEVRGKNELVRHQTDGHIKKLLDSYSNLNYYTIAGTIENRLKILKILIE